MSHNVRSLAKFVSELTFDQLGEAHIDRLKQSLLESIGAAIAAFDEPVLRSLRVHVKDFNSSGPCSLIGGVRCAPDMAAYHNSGLIGLLDGNDVYFGEHSTSYPSDTIAAILATLEYNGGDGKDLLTSMAAAYTSHISMNKALTETEEEEFSAPLAALAASVGVSRALKLDVERMVNGLNMAMAVGTCPHPVASGNMSDWMHMVRPNAVRHGVESAFFGMRGIGGVSHELEGEDRVPDLLEDYPEFKLGVDDLDVIMELSSRKYSANAQAQSAIEAAIHIRHLYDFSPEHITHVKLKTFGVAHYRLAGGNGQDCVDIVSREEASNSLPFLVAAALLNGALDESHYTHRYIRSKEMQALRGNVEVEHDPALDEVYPEQICCHLEVTLDDGSTHGIKKCDYLGHHTKPMDWDAFETKFHAQASDFANDQLRHELVNVIRNIEQHPVSKLTSLLMRVAPV